MRTLALGVVAVLLGMLAVLFVVDDVLALVIGPPHNLDGGDVAWRAGALLAVVAALALALRLRRPR
jgi:ethanolamine transporter EutH